MLNAIQIQQPLSFYEAIILLQPALCIEPSGIYYSSWFAIFMLSCLSIVLR